MGQNTRTTSFALAARRGAAPPRARPPLGRIGLTLAASWQGARELLRENAITRSISRAALVHAVRHPGRVLIVGLALAALGWGLDTQTHVETNLEKLVPQNMASLRNLDALERTSGVGGEIDLMVSGAKLATPATLQWMSTYEEAILRRYGYSSTRGCGKALLCPAFSLPDLFAGGATGVHIHSGQHDQRRVIEFYGKEVLPRLPNIKAKAA